MIVGLLPALGSGLGDLAATGQVGRLLDGYLAPYTRAFDRLVYFSYLPESLAAFTRDAWLAERVTVRAPRRPVPRAWRAVAMPWAHAADFRDTAVLRVFQLTGALPAVLARARFGVPYVTTYGFWYAELSRSRGRALAKGVLERVALRRAAAVIATTPALAARAATMAKRVELIPNGVDVARFAPLPRPRNVVPRILSVGRLSPEKNLTTAIRAVARLGRRARLVFVGAGPMVAPLRAEAQAAGVELDMPGVVRQEALPALYASADAFVLPSFTEGHPKALLEAMSSGVPAVVSDCAGNRALVEEGRTGLVFEATRPDLLASALERALGDEALAARLGAAARETVVARYDLRLLVDREIALLREIAGPAKASVAALSMTGPG